MAMGIHSDPVCTADIAGWAAVQERLFTLADTSAVLGAGATKDWLLSIPAGSAFTIWLWAQVAAENPGTVALYETPTLGAGGAGNALSEINADRTSSTAATLVATDDPDISAVGTLLRSVPSGYPLGGWPGELHRPAPFRLAPNASAIRRYLIRYTDGGLGSTATIAAAWTEL